MRVVWTEYAYVQLDQAVAFVARDLPKVAVEWLERMLDAAAGLAESGCTSHD